VAAARRCQPRVYLGGPIGADVGDRPLVVNLHGMRCLRHVSASWEEQRALNRRLAEFKRELATLRAV